MIKLYEKEKDCCGCSACKSICPKTAITMKEDQEGFLYPFIDKNLCIECGLCEKVCAFNENYDISENLSKPKVYALKHKDENVRKISTSGGAFSAISDYILCKGGEIYGATFDDKFKVIHTKAITKQECNSFKGSKYVQSDLLDCFNMIKASLLQNKFVLFSGTPCQCAGLNSYLNDLRINKSGLYLCDFVCHGVPSPLMWHNHIVFCEKKEKSRVVEYYCRSKIDGWHHHRELIKYDNGKISYNTSLTQKHKELFYSHLILRPSCHVCKYTNLNRPSDITIADFWGIEKTMPEFDDNKGVSLVLINTTKGNDVFSCIKNNITYEESNIKACIQPQLVTPTVPSLCRAKFWNDYFNKGYLYVIKKYAHYGFPNNVFNFTKKAIKVLKIKLKKIAFNNDTK